MSTKNFHTHWLRPPKLRTGNQDKARHATWLELFFDLVFVVAVAELAHELSGDVSLAGFGRFVALFVPVWWAWIGATYYANRFDTDDALHRLLTFVQMVAAAALAVNVHHGLGETSAGFAVSYAVFRFVLVLQYARAGRQVAEARALTRRFGTGFAVAATLWLLSAFVPAPWRFVLWAAGLAVDFATPISAGRLHTTLAPHEEHLPERFGLFTIIVLGESAVGVVNGVTEVAWTLGSFFTAVFGFAVAFALWWLYFDNVDGSAIRAAREGDERGAIKRGFTSTCRW